MRMMFRTKERGFTLIEAIITVTIIAIFAVMALPRLNSTRMQVRSVSRQIMGDMRYARTLAVTDNRNVEVRFDSKREYYIDGVKAKASDKLALYNIDCSPVPATFPTIFTFHNNGSASSNGKLTVSKDGHPPTTINITASTGMVKNEG
jgi:prepilin-type N-terminal cleavage/methylation domain-containing protein